jgi:mRNA-degrading endonuclease RelE of RelBE toxin-antitoxin system
VNRTRSTEYQIQFARSAQEHLVYLTARQQAVVLDAVKRQLRHEPLRETRNRKPLRPNPLAPWELRVDGLRVFYEVDARETELVNILAIGVKTGNRLFIAGKEIAI